MLSSFTRSNLDVHGVISVVFSVLCVVFLISMKSRGEILPYALVYYYFDRINGKITETMLGFKNYNTTIWQHWVKFKTTSEVQVLSSTKRQTQKTITEYIQKRYRYYL